METFQTAGIEQVPTILQQLNNMTTSEQFRFAAKKPDLMGNWFSATATKHADFFEVIYDDSTLEVPKVPFDERESLLSENLWELGWFGVPQQGGSSTVKSVHAITYSYEGHSVNASIQGAQVTLYQTVKIFQGVQQATFSTKDVALTTSSAPDCKKHVVIFYHAVVSKKKTCASSCI